MTELAQRETLRSCLQSEIADVVFRHTGARPIETTLTRSGVSLVFDTHEGFAVAYRFYRFGEGRREVRIVEVDFDETTDLRFLVIAPWEVPE